MDKDAPQNSVIKKLTEVLLGLEEKIETVASPSTEDGDVTDKEKLLAVECVQPHKMKTAREIMIDLVDNCVSRIRTLRETAFFLEKERDSLLMQLNSLITDSSQQLCEDDRAEIAQQIQNLIEQCQSVEISVETPRSDYQTDALFYINRQIDDLLKVHQENRQLAIQKCHSFINACITPYSVDDIDRRFENLVLDCTSDDQRRIHQRLIGLLNYFQSHL